MWNCSAADWRTGKCNRPSYANGNKGVLSTICDVKVCPAEAAKMLAELKKQRKNPDRFCIVGGNCTSHAAQVLAEGGITPVGIDGVDNPQNLIDQLKTKHNANCYLGWTKVDGKTSKAEVVKK